MPLVNVGVACDGCQLKPVAAAAVEWNDLDSFTCKYYCSDVKFVIQNRGIYVR